MKRCCVTGLVVPNISKDHDVFIFKGNQSISHGLIALKSEGNIILHTVKNHLPSAIVSEHSNLQTYTSFSTKNRYAKYVLLL